MTEINGICDAAFEPVREAFAANFDERGEIGASVAVVADGTPVVNLWAGSADPAGTRPWSFGHDGFGGSAVGCDPEAGVAFGYVMNRMGMNLADDPRKMAIIEGIYRSLDG